VRALRPGRENGQSVGGNFFKAMFLVAAMLASFFGGAIRAEAIEGGRPTRGSRGLEMAPGRGGWGLELHASHGMGILAHDAVHRVLFARVLERAGGTPLGAGDAAFTPSSSISRTQPRAPTRLDPENEMQRPFLLYAGTVVRCSAICPVPHLFGTSRDSHPATPAVKDVLLLFAQRSSTSCSFRRWACRRHLRSRRCSCPPSGFAWRASRTTTASGTERAANRRTSWNGSGRLERDAGKRRRK